MRTTIRSSSIRVGRRDVVFLTATTVVLFGAASGALHPSEVKVSGGSFHDDVRAKVGRVRAIITQRSSEYENAPKDAEKKEEEGNTDFGRPDLLRGSGSDPGTATTSVQRGKNERHDGFSGRKLQDGDGDDGAVTPAPASSCGETESFRITSSILPAIEGCFLSTPESFSNSGSPEIEVWSVTGTLALGQVLVAGVAGDESPWVIFFFPADDSDETGYCVSAEDATTVHPTGATWSCDLNQSGAFVEVTDDQVSTVCGCTADEGFPGVGILTPSPAVPATSPTGTPSPAVPATSPPVTMPSPVLVAPTAAPDTPAPAPAAPPSTSFCSNGFSGVENSGGSVCCHARCSACGGSGCSTFGASMGLTKYDCCSSGIKEARDACSVSGAAPCWIDGDTTTDGEDVDDGGDGGGEDCSVSALSDAEVEQLAMYDKSIYSEPDCLGGNAPEPLPVHCNYLGLGQECRGCFLTCDGAIKYMDDFVDEIAVWGEEAVIHFCPGTGEVDDLDQC